MSEFIRLTEYASKRRLLIAKNTIVLVQGAAGSIPTTIQTSMDGRIQVEESIEEISDTLERNHHE